MDQLTDPGALADLLARSGGYGVAAVFLLALIFERRENRTLQALLLKISTVGLQSKDPP